MDPLSITASITALLQLTQSLLAFANSIRHASQEQKRVAIEASSLYSLLTALKFRVEEAQSTEPWFNQVKLLGVENGPLSQLRHLLEQVVSKTVPSSTSTAVDRSLSKLTWHFNKKEVDELLGCIERLKTLINLALVNDLTTLAHATNNDVALLVKQTGQIKIDVDAVKQSISDELKARLSHWLGLPDPSVNYRAALAKRKSGTGKWLTGNSSFKDWKSSSSFSSMWLYGKPGCGKTVLSSTILEDIQQSAHGLSNSYVSYFFFDFNDQDKQSWKKAIRSLLFQFSLQLPGYFQALEQLYRSCQNGNQQPADDKLSALLLTCVAGPGSKYILLDALDECIDREPFLELLESLMQLREPGLHVIMTSRRERDIQDYVDKTVDYKFDIQSAVIEDDIRAFIQERLQVDRRLNKWPALVKDEITRELMKKADGMFRWVYCQLESLRNCIRLSSLRQALLSLPVTLDETYERIVTQIRSSGELDCAVWILQWLCFSMRPIRLSELNDVLAINIDDNKGFWPDERLPDPFDILSICSGFITCLGSDDAAEDGDNNDLNFDGSDDTENKVASLSDGSSNSGDPDVRPYPLSPQDVVEVRLAHYSVKEYLLSERSSLHSSFEMSICHEQIAKGCLEYLLHLCQRAPVTGKMLSEYPLAEYTVKEWYEHARGVKPELSEATLDAAACLTLTKHHNQVVWEQLYHWDFRAQRPRNGLSLDTDNGISPPLVSVAKLGLVDLLLKSINRGDNLEAKDNAGLTALHAASKNGYNDLVQLLLDRGADIEARDNEGRTALYHSLLLGNERVVELLLDRGADIEARDNYGSTALHRSSFLGNERVVELLLDRGADIDARDKKGWTALHHSSDIVNERAVELLLDRGADIEARDNDGWTALHGSSQWGREKVVELLLDKGADIDARNNHGWTALHLSSLMDNKRMVELLLDRGADIDARDNNGWTALHRSSHAGKERVVELLLDRGANPDLQTNDGMSPLSIALGYGYAKIIQMLKDRVTTDGDNFQCHDDVKVDIGNEET